ncbi:M50 family metallopeptidase [Gymnodinialimonas hymeniacidonis]|uniref:M50 family metallopeptidase n=1 Tax=Gymnodinialimonas hymeniacidonis TaxID=3126508 RepID=UPI0034C66DC7
MGDTPLFTLPGPWRIPIQFDVSLIVLAILFGVLYLDRGIGAATLAFGMIVVAILLHELGHAAACVVQGVPVTRVVLFGGGGFCEFTGSVTPKQEEFIAIAGPLVNLTLWALATLALPLTVTEIIRETIVNGYPIAPFIGPGPAYEALFMFARLNLFLALFNLIPVLPLDGGRLLNSWLHRFMRGITANKVSGAVGVGLAILWIPLLFAAYFTFGFVLLYFPSITLHWRLFRSGAA